MLQILQNYERLQQEVVRLHSENRRLESDNAAMKAVLSDKTGSWHHVDLLIQQIKHLKDKIADYDWCTVDWQDAAVFAGLPRTL